VQLDSQGDETSASYTVNFNQSVLTVVSAALGTGVPAGADIRTNTSQAAQGRVGILVSATNTYAMGTRQMALLTFTVAANATAGMYPLTFSSSPVAQFVANAREPP
jgi:hypothetical protein